jgi:hypothetical protein
MNVIPLKENLDLLRKDPTTQAAAQAKKMGLVYVGFGRYEDPKTNQITHVVLNDRLVPYKRAAKTNQFKERGTNDMRVYTNSQAPLTQQIHEKLRKHYSPEKYKDEELDAIHTYTNLGYLDINERLSQVPSSVPASKIEPMHLDDPMPDVIKNLDSALNKSRSPINHMVYTTLSPDIDISAFKPGSAFSFRGYRDCSINMETVLPVEAADPNVRQSVIVLQIEVKKNVKGMYIADYSAIPEDGEFLFPRGTKIEIVDGPNKIVGSDQLTGALNMEILYFSCIAKN